MMRSAADETVIVESVSPTLTGTEGDASLMTANEESGRLPDETSMSILTRSGA
jgi:hypothetical protein